MIHYRMNAAVVVPSLAGLLVRLGSLANRMPIEYINTGKCLTT